jgi:hypothetical protein
MDSNVILRTEGSRLSVGEMLKFASGGRQGKIGIERELKR